MENTFYQQSYGIYYKDHGAGRPVLMLHGFGEDSRIFDDQVAALKDHCRVIVPDLPGIGKSAPIGTGAQMAPGLPASIDLMAETMNALMRSLRIDSFSVIGHSMGGYIALAMAEKFAGSIQALGLVHSTAFADSEEKKATRKKGIGFIKKNGGFAFLQTSIPGLFSDTFKIMQPGKIAALIEQFNPATTGNTTLDATLIAFYEAMISRPDRTEILRTIKAPVLFIIGTEDKAVPMADSLKQVHLPQTCFVHLLENTAHMSMMENTEKLNRYLLDFIKN